MKAIPKTAKTILVFNRNSLVGTYKGKDVVKAKMNLKRQFPKNSLKCVNYGRGTVGMVIGTKKPRKTRQASQVLQLMDEDKSYSQALRKVLSMNKGLSRTKLERDLDPFI